MSSTGREGGGCVDLLIFILITMCIAVSVIWFSE
jgi:hypothetical protein